MKVYDYLKYLPITINNYYGDPIIQFENTITKLKTLSDDGHLGPVSIITKGYISKEKAKKIKKVSSGLKLVVLVSISELPKEIEPLGQEHRYDTIKNLIENDIKCMGYIRPFIPPYNTNAETVEKIFNKLNKVRCNAVIISGFRGNDEIIHQMNIQDKEKWVLRVKQMPKQLGQIIEEQSKKYNITVFSRTACGVSWILGDNSTFNPYYNSPMSANCDKCPINDTCKHVKPSTECLDIIKKLGYDIEYIESNKNQKCTVTADNRLDCPSCCTSCYILDVPRIVVKNENIGLGDIAFIRFITGVLVNKQGVVDGGKQDVAHVHMPNIKNLKKEIHCINTWYVWARDTSKCYGCKYCIVPVYKLKEKEYGMSPKELSIYIEKELKKNGK